MNILVCGRIKKGKTVLAIALAHEFSSGVVVWDPRHMVRGVIVKANREGSLAENLEIAIREKKFLEGPLVINPSSDLEGDFAAICGVLFNPPERFAPSGFAFVVDEAADLQRSMSINDSLRVAVKQHPRSVIVVQCTHSLQEWSRASKDTMSHLYCFQLQGRSLTAVVEYSDVEDEEKLRSALRSLKDHWYIHIDFEVSGGQPSWKVCQPLNGKVVNAIQVGEIPKEKDYGEKQRGSEMDTIGAASGRRGRERSTPSGYYSHEDEVFGV
jgi:hypothetical protein